MKETTLPRDRMENVISVFGSVDQNLRIIESELGGRVTDRDDQLRISGEAEDVMAAEKAINGLLQLASRGEAIDAQNVRYILKLVGEGREAGGGIELCGLPHHARGARSRRVDVPPAARGARLEHLVARAAVVAL